MALTIDFDARIDGRKYPNLPDGVNRWVAQGSGTGTTTSFVTATCRFNPSQVEDFQKYVSVDRVTVKTGVAALTVSGVEVSTQDADWEDAPGLLEAFTTRATTSSVAYLGSSNDTCYLGRSKKGTLGRLQVILQEINLTTYAISMSGLISDHPFIAPDYLRA